MRKSLYKANFYRAFCTPTLYVAVGCFVLLILLTSLGILRKYADEVINVISYCIDGSGLDTILFCILPVIPFAAAYADDHRAGAIQFYTIRSGVGRYAASQFGTALFLGFCTVFAGLAICGLVFLPFMPLSRSYHAYDAYAPVLINGHALPYALLLMINRSLSGAIMAAFGACAASFIPNRYVVFIAPTVVYMLFGRAINSNNTILPMFLTPPYVLGTLIYDAGGPAASILLKLGISAALCVLLGLVTVLNVKRRQRHE